MQLSASQLALLRSRPHQANLFLSIYRPKTLMSAQVMSGTYNNGDIQINYMNVTTGSYANLYPDLTVLIGTTPGQDDYGRLRMRSATGTYIIFSENALNWTEGMYLTFIDQIDVQAIYPRIIQDPNNQTNVIFYKDYDIVYTNQNQIYGTFPNAGPHRAGFVPSGTFYFTASGTYNVLGEALTYSWIFDGGTPTGSNAHTPGNVRWTTPGHYKVRLQVTSASGAVDTTYRYVSFYNHPGGGSNNPILQWELTQFSGSRSEGGYTASFKVYQDLGDVQPNAVVVLFSDNFYGGTQVNLGGNAVGNPSIFFVGYIIGDSIKFDYQSSSVEFSVGSISEIMKQAEGFSVSCESKATPTTWFQLYEMNIQRAIYHYLRWHSTVLKVADFQYTGDSRLVQYFDSDRGSLYDAVDSFIRNGLLGELVVDRQGKLWAEISSFGMENPLLNSNIPNTLTFQKQDWVDSPTITERRNSDLAFFELGGIAYYGVSSNTFSALLSNAPSTVPLYHGKSDRKEGMILSSQVQLNQVTGNYLAYNNAKFPEVSLSLGGIYTNLDIAPQEKFFLVIDQNDTVRNKSLQNIPFLLASMDWKYSAVSQSLVPEIVFNPIVTGTPGVTVQIPANPPDNGYAYPDLNLPPLPDFGGTPGVGSTVPMFILFHDTVKGIIYSDNFDSGSPNYVALNGGMTQSQYQNLNVLFMTPNGAVYAGRVDANVGGSYLFRAPAIGQTFSRIDLGTDNLNAISFRPDAPETVALVRFNTSTTVKDWYMGVGGTFSKTFTLATELFNGSISYGDNSWLYTTYGAYRKINQAGTSVTRSGTIPGGNNLHHWRNGYTCKRVIAADEVARKWYIGNAGDFNSPDSITDTNLREDGMSVALSPDGLQIMAGYNPAGGGKSRTADGGYSWTPLPNLPPGADYNWAYAGSGDSSITSTRWVLAAHIIRYSPDFGNSWINKEGDYLTQINFVPNIDMIFVIGITQRNSFTFYN